MASSREHLHIFENGNNESAETRGDQGHSALDSKIRTNKNITAAHYFDGSTNDMEQQNACHAPRNHFTRSRNLRSSNSNITNSEEEPKSSVRLEKHSGAKSDLSIDTCASIMAELDSRSYNRSLLEDANYVMERILQPMSLPWTHEVIPVARNIPCDIDEMIDVLTADDGSHAPFANGNFGFGQYETGSFRSGVSAIRLANSSENFRAAARRSAEPGIIQFSTTVLPSTLPSYRPENLSAIPLPLTTSTNDLQDDDRSIRGETELRCFEAIQTLKKRKIEQARSRVASYDISVKISSSSSRSTIFTSSSEELGVTDADMPSNTLEAVLPVEVENGRKMTKMKGKLEAEKLGSYDIRHGLSSSQSSKSSKTPVGRTRLVWTSKISSDQPQRVSFLSLLTGKKLENGAHKRPRNIVVRLKVDGKVYRPSKEAVDEDHEDHEKESYSVGVNLQASLECDGIVKCLLETKPNKIELPDSLPPIIESVPDSTGIIHVVCTSPGTISSYSVQPSLMRASQNRVSRCTVCWKSTEGGLEVKKCMECGLSVHIQCCLDPGEYRILSTTSDLKKKEQWKCSVCCYREKEHGGTCGTTNASHMITSMKKSKRKSIPSSKLKDPQFESMQVQKRGHSNVTDGEIACAICLRSGGAMSQITVESEIVWVHEVCRIWTANQKVSTSSKIQSCALCGSNSNLSTCFGSRKYKSREQTANKIYSSRRVVRCAAVGCHVFVHPMCALVSSLTSQWKNESNYNGSENHPLDRINVAKKRDTVLCSQYTLTFASVCGKTSGVRCATTIPIFFCGIHNPAREQSFYGLNPGGEKMNTKKNLKIPSWNE